LISLLDSLQKIPGNNIPKRNISHHVASLPNELLRNVTTTYWKDIKNQKEFVQNIIQKLQLKGFDDFATRLTVTEVLKNGGAGLLYLLDHH
jgi:hypothetical protein